MINSSLYFLSLGLYIKYKLNNLISYAFKNYFKIFTLFNLYYIYCVIIIFFINLTL